MALEPSFPFTPAAGYQPPFVQPHINPRFAGAFGMNMGVPPPHHPTFPQNDTHDRMNEDPTNNSKWADEWVVLTGDASGDGI